MPWFKYQVGSIDKPFVFDLIDTFGAPGYLIYFGTVDIIADNFDINHPGFCRLPLKLIATKLQVSATKVSKVLQYCSENEKKIKELPYIRATFNTPVKGMVELECSKLAELADDYTRKALKKLAKQSPEKTGHPPEKDRVDVDTDIDTDVDTDTDETPLDEQVADLNLDDLGDIFKATPEDFDKFWFEYPKKKNKKAAIKAWGVMCKSKDCPELSVVLDAVKLQRASHDWTKEKGQFIPYPATWINAGGWMNEEPEVGDNQTSDTTQENIKTGQGWLENQGENEE